MLSKSVKGISSREHEPCESSTMPRYDFPFCLHLGTINYYQIRNTSSPAQYLNFGRISNTYSYMQLCSSLQSTRLFHRSLYRKPIVVLKTHHRENIQKQPHWYFQSVTRRERRKRNIRSNFNHIGSKNVSVSNFFLHYVNLL